MWRSRTTWSCHAEKTTGFLLVHWFWMSMSWWHIWPIWSYNYQCHRKTHSHHILQWCSSDWRCFEKCGQVHEDRPDLIVFIPVAVNTRSLWLYTGSLITVTFCVCFSSILIVRLVLWPENGSEESDQFRCCNHGTGLDKLKGSVGLITLIQV